MVTVSVACRIRTQAATARPDHEKLSNKKRNRIAHRQAIPCKSKVDLIFVSKLREELCQIKFAVGERHIVFSALASQRLHERTIVSGRR